MPSLSFFHMEAQMPPLAGLLWIRLQNSVRPKDSDVALPFVSTITADMPVLLAQLSIS